ncbi:MAG: hypothetical protein K0R06_3480 [Clostridium sp.]|jgi:hypothetical protein|nr:hypothetical protein [Clostridium sp.]
MHYSLYAVIETFLSILEKIILQLEKAPVFLPMLFQLKIKQKELCSYISIIHNSYYIVNNIFVHFNTF